MIISYDKIRVVDFKSSPLSRILMKEDIIQSNIINIKCYARVVTVFMNRRVISFQGIT